MNKSPRLYASFLWLSLIWLVHGQAVAIELSFVAASGQSYAHPHDIVLSPDQRYLYVADNNNDRIAVLEPFSLQLIGTFGEGEVGEPHDVAFDSVGRLLVADTSNSRVALYAVEGAQAELVGEIRGAVRRPEGVVAHPNGRVYATGAASGNVAAFENGVVVARTGGLSAPHDITVASDGTLWIADAGSNRLVNMTEDLELIRAVGGPAFDFSGPRYLDVDDAGRLYVADKYNHQIKVLAGDGTLLLTLGSGRGGLGAGVFDRPEGIVVRGRDVWFSDTYNDRIVRYRIVD